MMKVILDTNVLVSAVLGGKTRRILDLWLAGSFELVVTSDILDEYLTVLRRPKFKLPREVIEDIGLYLHQKASFVTPLEKITAVADDPKDDRFLEAAVAGNVHLIVSGDHHLLNLGAFRQIPIWTVRQFLEELDSKSN